LEYSKYLEKTSPLVSIPSTAYEGNLMKGIIPWSQHAKGLFSFAPIIPVDEFFKDDYNKPYTALDNHSLEQSPCYPIIGAILDLMERWKNGLISLVLLNDRKQKLWG
jgi:hypothetical protein